MTVIVAALEVNIGFETSIVLEVVVAQKVKQVMKVVLADTLNLYICRMAVIV